MPFDLHSLRSKVEGRIEAVQNEDANSTGEYVCAVRCARSPQCILRHPHLCAIVCRTQHPKRLIFLSTECARKRVARIAGGLSLATFFSSHTCRCRHFWLAQKGSRRSGSGKMSRFAYVWQHKRTQKIGHTSWTPTAVSGICWRNHAPVQQLGCIILLLFTPSLTWWS